MREGKRMIMLKNVKIIFVTVHRLPIVCSKQTEVCRFRFPFASNKRIAEFRKLGDMETWRHKHETWKYWIIETWRHGREDMDIKTWRQDMHMETWTGRHDDMAMDRKTWTWRHRHGDMDMRHGKETKTCRHGIKIWGILTLHEENPTDNGSRSDFP